MSAHADAGQVCVVVCLHHDVLLHLLSHHEALVVNKVSLLVVIADTARYLTHDRCLGLHIERELF